MYDDGLLDRGSAITPDLKSAAFQNGDAAMIICGPWLLEALRKANVPFAVSAFPEGSRPVKPFLGVQGFMVSAFSKKQLLAQTFLQKFVATPKS